MKTAATTTVAVAVVLSAAALCACGAAAPLPSGTPAGSTPPESTRGVSTPGAGVAAATPAQSPSFASEAPLDKPTRKHPLRVYFGGDSLSGMPAVWLGILRKKDGLARVRADYVESSRLTYGEPVDWAVRLKEQLSAGHYDVGVFMIGANDSGMPMTVGGESVMYPKKAWLEEYERRAKRIGAILLRAGLKRVYWVGMPIMPSSSESGKMRALNKVFEQVAASSPDIEYVDSYALLATKGGDYDASLRSGDGVHYTEEGAKTIAKAVWKAIKEGWGGR
jgi:hypothetical protein